MNFLKKIVLGFIAGAIATVTVHEIISALFHNPGIWTGWPRPSWNMDPAEMTGIPQIVSDMFWGGLWGSLFGLILGDRPHGSTTLKGILMGLIGPALIGVFLVIPFFTGRFPMFFGGESSKIIPVLVILAGFGAATAWLYGMFQYGHLPGFGDEMDEA